MIEMKKYLFMLAAAICFAGCQSLEDTYKDMAGDGPIRYLGKCSELRVEPGWECLKLSWENNVDPVISNVRVRWASDNADGEAILPKGTTRYDIVDLSDGIYEISLCSIDEKGNASLESTSTGRPYTIHHEVVRSFSHVVLKHIFIKDRLVLFFDALSENLKDVRLRYTKADGTAGELILNEDLIRSRYMLLGERIDPSLPVTVERTGVMIEKDGDDKVGTVVNIQLPPYELARNRSMAVDFKMAIEANYGKVYNDDAFVENLAELELDYSIDSFEDILYFPNLTRLHLGKNRYQWDDKPDYRIIQLYGDASKVYDLGKAMFVLDAAFEISGLAVDRYNRHYLPAPSDRGYVSEKGNPAAPERTFIDASDWNVTDNIKDNASFDSHLEYLFDGDIESSWDTEQTGQLYAHQIDVDMGAVNVLEGVQVFQRRFNPDSRSGTPQYLRLMPLFITIQYSTDKVNWQDASFVRGNLLGNTVGEITEIKFPEPRTARYLRIGINEMANGSNYAITLAEIRFF